MLIKYKVAPIQKVLFYSKNVYFLILVENMEIYSILKLLKFCLKMVLYIL